jgi:hypothetical protein
MSRASKILTTASLGILKARLEVLYQLLEKVEWASLRIQQKNQMQGAASVSHPAALAQLLGSSAIPLNESDKQKLINKVGQVYDFAELPFDPKNLLEVLGSCMDLVNSCADQTTMIARPLPKLFLVDELGRVLADPLNGIPGPDFEAVLQGDI